MKKYLFKWLSPIISLKEVEGLFGWINTHLRQSGGAPLSAVGQVSIFPLMEPEEALSLTFPLTFPSEVEAEQFREAIWSEYFSTTLHQPHPFAISLLPEEVSKTKKQLCVFDMDSTVINEEVIDELARMKNFYEEVAAITEEAMKGKIDFKQSLFARCGLLRGMPFHEAQNVISELTLSPGASALFESLRSQRVKTAIVSGGFEFALRHYQKQLNVDHIFAHSLIRDDDDVLTGEVEEPIIDAAHKQKLVKMMKSNDSVTTEATVTIGDGANDVMMMSEAGMSVSFCGKPKLVQIANTLILNRNLLWLKHLI